MDLTWTPTACVMWVTRTRMAMAIPNTDETTSCIPASDPLDPVSTPVDTDGDLSCDTLDTDDDNDTIPDGVDIDPPGSDALSGPGCRRM